MWEVYNTPVKERKKNQDKVFQEFAQYDKKDCSSRHEDVITSYIKVVVNMVVLKVPIMLFVYDTVGSLGVKGNVSYLN